ncbi:MAG: transposase [Thermodesulfobacteriota bacterium]
MLRLFSSSEPSTSRITGTISGNLPSLGRKRRLTAPTRHPAERRQIWNQPDNATAEAVLQDWLGRAEASGIRIVKKFAHTLATYRAGFLAYYDYPISTGPLEATNNKIKTLQRQAYGFRDQGFFILKIYACHLSTSALVG